MKVNTRINSFSLSGFRFPVFT